MRKNPKRTVEKKKKVELEIGDPKCTVRGWLVAVSDTYSLTRSTSKLVSKDKRSSMEPFTFLFTKIEQKPARNEKNVAVLKYFFFRLMLSLLPAKSAGLQCDLLYLSKWVTKVINLSILVTKKQRLAKENFGTFKCTNQNDYTLDLS